VTETAPIAPGALRYAREQQRLSQRELGRRVARRLGRAEAARAFQVRLSRIEQRDEITEEDRVLVDALAEELALGEGDLATPPRWIWVRPNGGRLTFLAFGLRMPVFSSPEKARDSRDALALETNGQSAAAFEDGQLWPIHRGPLARSVLDTNFGPDLTDSEREFLLPLDPDLNEMRFLWALQQAISGATLVAEGEAAEAYGERVDLAEDSARFALKQPGFQAELIELHRLALRRLEHAPPEGAHLVESWKREEEALYTILDRIHELRREERELTLGGQPRNDDEQDA
jgi:hypothetical protein